MQKRRNRKSKSLAKRLAGYSVTAGAALAAGHQVQADIIWSGDEDILVNAASPVLDIDLDKDQAADFRIEWHSWYFSASSWGRGLDIQAFQGGEIRISDTMFSSASRLITSDQVDVSMGSWQTGAGLATSGSSTMTGSIRQGNFLGQAGYVAVKFDSGETTCPGWIAFEGASDATWGRVTGWACETETGTIHVPDIPEPTSLAMFALGAAGVAAFRRKRKA